jgi:hypothetical protein
MAPATLVNTVLGSDVQPPKVINNGPVVGCTYPSPTAFIVIVRFETDTDAATFARAKAGFTQNKLPVTDVVGFQDEAYSSTTGSGDHLVNTLVARKGSVEILVVAPATIDREKDLEGRLFAAL